MTSQWRTARRLGLVFATALSLAGVTCAPVLAQGGGGQDEAAPDEPGQAIDPLAASARTFAAEFLGGGDGQEIWRLTPPAPSVLEGLLDDDAMSTFVLRRVRAGLSEQQAQIASAAYPRYAARDFAAAAAAASGWNAQVEQVRRSRFRREAVVRIGAAGPSGERLELDWRIGESQGEMALLDLYVNGASRLSAHQIAVEAAFDEGGGVGVVMELDAGP